MRVVTWNVNKRVGTRLHVQTEALNAMWPDIVGLQEITARTSDVWIAALAAIGLQYAVSSLDLVPEARTASRPSRSGVLLASRWPLQSLPVGEYRVPFPERVVASSVATPFGPVEVHVAHVPSGSRMRELGLPRAKAETFEAIFERLARPSPNPRILCGDFNAPRGELPEGTVIPWGPDARTAAAEVSVLQGLAEHDLVDVYRRLHGYDAQAFSWYGPRRGYRLDHVLATRALTPVTCGYEDALRISRASDHAPMWADFRW